MGPPGFPGYEAITSYAKFFIDDTFKTISNMPRASGSGQSSKLGNNYPTIYDYSGTPP
jgi:hypothetical protein